MPIMRSGEFFIVRIRHRRGQLVCAVGPPSPGRAILPIGTYAGAVLSPTDARRLAGVLPILRCARKRSTRHVAGKRRSDYLPLPVAKARRLIDHNRNYFSWAYAVWSLARSGPVERAFLLQVLSDGSGAVGHAAGHVSPPSLPLRRANWIFWCLSRKCSRRAVVGAFRRYVWRTLWAADSSFSAPGPSLQKNASRGETEAKSGGNSRGTEK